jgi:phospholipid N-methyltransferase
MKKETVAEIVSGTVFTKLLINNPNIIKGQRILELGPGNNISPMRICKLLELDYVALEKNKINKSSLESADVKVYKCAQEMDTEKEFDYFISCFSLCSFKTEVFVELLKKLKAGGIIYFLEHNMSESVGKVFVEKSLKPLVLCLSGCDTTFDINNFSRLHGLKIISLEESSVPTKFLSKVKFGTLQKIK